MIIALPIVSPARLRLPASAAAGWPHAWPCWTVERLLSTIDDAASTADPKDCARTVARLLAETLTGAQDLAGLPWSEGEGGQTARLELAQTPLLRIFARRWQPGQMGPLCRFMDWFAYGVAEGCLTELIYPEGQAPHHLGGPLGIRPGTSERRLRQGDVWHGPGAGERLCRLVNHAGEVAISVHVEGLPQPVAATKAVVMPLAPPPLVRPRLMLIAGGRRG